MHSSSRYHFSRYHALFHSFSPSFLLQSFPQFFPKFLDPCSLAQIPHSCIYFPKLAPTIASMVTSPLLGTICVHPLSTGSLCFDLDTFQSSSRISRTSPMSPCSISSHEKGQYFSLCFLVPLSVFHFLTPPQSASRWAVPHGLSPGTHRCPLPVTFQREVSVAEAEREGDRTLLKPFSAVEKEEFM